MAVIIAGYLSGIIHKAFYALDWIILLYAANMAMVVVDLILYYRYSSTPNPSTRS